MVTTNRTSRTLIYAPQIQVIVASDTGVFDLSADVVNGQVRRVINGVSQFSCVLNNRNQKYTGVLKRMDRITISFSRIGKWVQVFSGYLDSVPAIALYTATCQIRASCTLKRLMHTWWDPGLPESQTQILDQTLYDNGGNNSGSGNGGATSSNGKEFDSGIGRMLGNLLFKVGSWQKDQIKIQNLPAGFLNLALEVSVQQQAENQKAVSDLRKALGFSSLTTGANNNPTSIITTQKLTGILPPRGSQNSYNITQLVNICRAVGFLGDSIATAATIAYMNSGGKPGATQSVNSNLSAVEYDGLFGLLIGATAATSVSGRISQPEALDALTCANIFFALTVGGTDFKTNGSSFLTDIYDARATSQPWQIAFAQAKAAMLLPIDKTGLLFGPTTATSATANAPGTTTVTTTAYGLDATTDYLKGVYGNSAAAVEANLVTIVFQGQSVRVHRLASNAFQKVDAQLTFLNLGYKIKQLDTYKWRPMNNGNANAPLSWHSFGIAMDINWAQNGSVSAGMKPYSSDIPAAWVQVFKQNGFTWGGLWGSPDYMHFQWLGGGTYTGIVGADGAGGTVLAGVGSSDKPTNPIGNPFEVNLFNYMFMGMNIDTTSLDLQHDHAPINDVQLLTTVQSICAASMRSFMSGPDGTFIAFYPDYFGVAGTAPVLTIQDIELLNFNVDVSDDNLATDVFVAGGGLDMYNPSVTAQEWYLTAGVANIRQSAVMSLLLGVDGVNDPEFSASAIYARFGLRPLKMEYAQVAGGVMEYLQALSLFQKKWSEQYSTEVQFTFMPELYPGMRVLIKSHGVVVFVEQVTHTFSFDAGFQTAATVSSPARLGGGIKGMNLGRL